MATSIFKEYFKGYEILGELGRGNARVLKARSLQTGTLVAIKHFAFNTDPDTLRRFQRESEIMKSIQHDYIVKIIDVHLDAELPYIVMQLVEGGDLRSLLKNYGTLDIPTVIRLAHHLTEALDAIHANAVVHRDVKPENIMYRRLPTGEIHFLLTDFGIARLREQVDAITVTGASMLTYDYASPEQFNQSRTVSTPTDYYSLGVVMYECLTGAVPFEYEQDDLLTHISRVIGCPPPMPRLPEGRWLPPSMLQLLQGLLAKQPLDRIADPVKVRHLLKMAAIEDIRGPEALSHAERSVPKHTLKNNTPPPVRSGKKSNVTFTLLVLLLISVAVFFSWTTIRKTPVVAEKSQVPNAVMPEAKENNEAPAVPAYRATLADTTASAALHTLPLPVDSTALAGMPPAADNGVALLNGMYFNDFSDQQDSLWETGSDGNSDFHFLDGKYVITGFTDSLSYSTAVKFKLDIQRDFAISAKATHWGESSDNPFGLNYCGDEDQDSFFVFYITSNGYYSIGSWVKNEWNILVDWTATENIHPDSEMNILSIEKQYNSMRFYINDKLVKILPFTGGFGNAFGLRVDGAQTVSFDQFIVKGNH
jgi:serine/threonine protein kinase